MSSAWNPESFEELLAQTDWVRTLVRRLLGSAHEADVDDLVQDTMLRAMTTPPDTSRPVRGWLATVARNLFRERHRSESRRASHEGHARPRPPMPSPDEATLLAERHRVVVECVLGLPEPYRHTLLLHYLHEVSLREIAEQLREPLATIRSRLQRGRELLRDAVRLRFDEQGEDWAAALLPLAGWPDGVPPAVPSPSDGASGGSLSLPWAAALVVGAGLVVASIWWGDWWAAGTDSSPAVEAMADAADDATPVDRTRVAPTAGADESAGTAGTTDASEALDSSDGTTTGAATPHGAVRVVVEGLPDDMEGPPELLIEPFLATRAEFRRFGKIEPSHVALTSADASLDLRALFGPGLDVADVELTLRHPQLLPSRLRAVPAREGDPGVPAVFRVERAATATGRISDASGAPVEGAVVLVGRDSLDDRGRPQRRVVDETTSDASGGFAVALPPGTTVHIIATAAGHAPGAETIRAPEAGDRLAVDVQLGRGHTITGRVQVSPGDDPSVFSASALLVMHPAHYLGRGAYAVVDDDLLIQPHVRVPVHSDGTFVLDGLAQRPYTVSVDRGYSAHRGDESVSVIVSAPSDQVVLDQRLVDVPFRIMDQNGPRANVYVHVAAREGEALPRASATTDAEGRVVLSLLRGEAFTWTADVPRATDAVTGEGATPDAGPADEVEVWAEATPGTSWTVRLELADGSPVQHATFLPVSDEMPSADPRAIEVDGVDGLFEVRGLRSGPQTVTIRVAAGWLDSRTYWQDIPVHVNLPTSGTPDTHVVERRGGRLRIRARRADVDDVFARCVVRQGGEIVPCGFAVRQPAGGKGAGPWSSGPADSYPVLDPGEYQLHLTSNLCHDEHRTVTIVEGEVSDVEVTFRPK